MEKDQQPEQRDVARALGWLVRRLEFLEGRLAEHRKQEPPKDTGLRNRYQAAQRHDAEEIAALKTALPTLRLMHAELADEDRASTVLRDAIQQIDVLLEYGGRLTPTQRMEAEMVKERGAAVLRLIG